MLKNYFVSAVRRLMKMRAYSALNILGLSIGLACFTLIGLWVMEELGYDRFHSRVDRIYRVGAIFTDESGSFDQAVTPPPLGPALVSDMPEVEATVRVDKNDAVVRRGDVQFVENDLLLVDATFFSVFDFPLRSGNPATALSEAYSVVLSESMSRKYFGDADPVGQSLKIYLYDPDGQGKEYAVTGVVADCPQNSQFRYNMLISFKTMELLNPEGLSGEGWYWNGYYTYVCLREGSDRAALEGKLPALIEKYMGKTNREWKISYTYFLQPLASIHLQSHLRYEIGTNSSVTFLLVFGTVGILVLLLACINYINLNTSFSLDRYHEVGVRKALGAHRSQLMGQYLSEALLVSMASLLLALVWIELARPFYEGLTGKQVTGLYTAPTLTLLTAIAALVGLVSGAYPAFLLSSFNPASALKGTFRTGFSLAWLRKGLVVFQYAISIILVIGILVVQMQFRFIQGKDLGFDPGQLLVLGVNGSQEVRRGYDAFAREVVSLGIATHAARSNSMITNGLGNSVAEMEDPSGKVTNATVYRLRVDYDYLDAYGMKLVAGRFFSRDFNSDSTKAYVVNETLVKKYGYTDPADVIGKKYTFGGNTGTVIGVVRDFHYNSLQFAVDPTCMYLLNTNFSRIALRLDGASSNRLKEVAGLWKKHFPNSVFDYVFADDALDNQYNSEQRFNKVFVAFSVLSLAIACMGLFALVSFAVENRTKEIGIRKVLGASAPQILLMLSREFLRLVAVASLIAVPLGWYAMQQWLNGFAYRMEIHPLVALAAVVAVLVVAWMTISARSLSAANANPVESLRSE